MKTKERIAVLKISLPVAAIGLALVWDPTASQTPTARILSASISQEQTFGHDGERGECRHGHHHGDSDGDNDGDRC